ncbi:CHAT domain-containing protein [Haladaptatus sp. DYF46]|uniref:CHAT domain-containing protein n=1 Tax=Haladaptatus sp. DYF46 TaxID=2886041 RepID=UPI001E442930|nr:CHAT domain-containing protein [Haladaptatus sp. DYF46]
MEFRRHAERAGLDIYDAIENVRFALFTGESVHPTPVDTSGFYFPVDAAVEIETPTLEIPQDVPVALRGQNGTMIVETSDERDRTLGSDDYLVELSTTPMKLYFLVNGRLTLEHRDDTVRFSFDGKTAVRVGARSFHDRPAGTITVTDDVRDTMRAVSRFGSALKTLSPERSFPTLRGHPPLVERGDEFAAPTSLDPPETDVKLVVPPDREHVYPVVSLAYYLGASVVPGGDPRLVAGSFERSLTGPGGYVETVNRTLRQVFFLDCLTRTEGYYTVELHEREAVEPLVDLDFADLYEMPLAERLAAYLSVPFRTLESHIPNWRLGVDLTPTAENVEYTPYLAKDLALVRIPDTPTPKAIKPMSDAQTEFFRSPSSDALARGVIGWDTVDERDVFQVDPMSNVIEQAWAGPGYPLTVNKLDVSALRRRIDRRPSDDTIDIHVVCNDERMMEEDTVRELYGLRDLLDFDVTAHYDLSREEFADLLARSADFVHYIGHVDDSGILCADGPLDVKSVSEVGASAFLLNACQSYEQGHELVTKGSRGGVVTLSPVGNPMATELGRTLARLLNCGFPLRVALSIAQRHSTHGYQYTVLGDGGLSLVQSERGIPRHISVERTDGDRFDVEVNAYPTDLFGFGSHVNLDHVWSRLRYLASEPLTRLVLTTEQLRAVCSTQLLPIEIGGELHWSDESDLFTSD